MDELFLEVGANTYTVVKVNCSKQKATLQH